MPRTRLLAHIWPGQRLSEPNPSIPLTKGILPRLSFLIEARTKTLGAHFDDKKSSDAY